MDPARHREELFSSWRWKVYDHCPHDQMCFLDAMNAGCLDISAKDGSDIQKRLFPSCIAREDIQWMSACGQMQKTGLTNTAAYLMLSYTN